MRASSVIFVIVVGAVVGEVMAKQEVITARTRVRVEYFKDKVANKCKVLDTKKPGEYVTPNNKCDMVFNLDNNKWFVSKTSLVPKKPNAILLKYYAPNDRKCQKAPVKTVQYTLNVCRNNAKLSLVPESSTSYSITPWSD